jgi:glycosyltransferase involved in cell wall biosynthesis
MTMTSLRMLRAALATRAEICHFHDPELIPVGLALRAAGRRVIYDVHEDVPRQILYKPYLPKPARRVVGAGVGLLEGAGRRAFDGIVAATPRIATRFAADTTAVVQNFPLLSELSGELGPPYAERERHVVYIGRVTPEIGAREMVRAAAAVATPGARFTIAGPIARSLEAELAEATSTLPIETPGWQDRNRVAELLGSARVGLVLFHPVGNYVEAYPTKMFEYMAAGLPVVASDFPLWRTIVDEAGCGLLVDPLDPAQIAAAIDRLLADPDEARAMGERGREAVMTRFNWGTEERKLLDLYARVLAGPSSG